MELLWCVLSMCDTDESCINVMINKKILSLFKTSINDRQDDDLIRSIFIILGNWNLLSSNIRDQLIESELHTLVIEEI